MIAACATACIIARANHGDVQAVTAARLYRAAYKLERDQGYPDGWTAACATARDFRTFLLDRGLRDSWAIDAELTFSSMYATATYGLPVSCWSVSG